MLLNKEAYKAERDNLIYDMRHPIDATTVQASIEAEENGIIRRGQILDYINGSYKIHEEGGVASVIVAENTSYAADENEVVIPVYIRGSFRASEVIAIPEITAEDIETLRSRGIYLK